MIHNIVRKVQGSRGGFSGLLLSGFLKFITHICTAQVTVVVVRLYSVSVFSPVAPLYLKKYFLLSVIAFIHKNIIF